MALLFDALSDANAAADRGDQSDAMALAGAINALFGALGLTLLATSHEVDEHSAALVARRDAARAAKSWAEAELEAMGWVVEDSAAGTQIRPS